MYICHFEISSQGKVASKMREEDKLFNDVDAIHSAVRDEKVETVEELLNRGVSPNLQNRQGETPLHVACRSNESSSTKIDSLGRLTILKLLWESGARINAKGPRKETALHVAVKSQLVDVVDFLLRSGAIANCRDRDERTPLHLAASAAIDAAENEKIIQLLLQHGANFHAQDSRWKSPLIEAVCSGNGNVVRVLLKAGTQIDHANRLGLSGIFYACETQSVEMVKLLLQHHANVNIRDQRKKSTPLHFIAGSGRYYTFGDDAANRSDVIARLLIEAGAQIDAADVDKSTALHIAVDTKDEGLVAVLLDAGAGVDVKDEYGNTPLHVLLFTAQEHNCNEARLERIAKLLVEKGANVNEQNNNFETPFHYAVWRGNPIIVSNLLKNGADVHILWHAQKGSFKFLHETPICNTPEICGDNVEEAFTPLNVAATLGHLEVTNLLLDRSDVDAEAANVTGNHDVTKTPLYFAIRNGHYEVTKLLLDAGCQINRFVLHNTTVLHVAVSQGNAALIYLLLEYNVNFQVKDFYGRNALSCAVEYERESMEKIAKIIIMHYVKQEFRNASAKQDDLITVSFKNRAKEYLMDCENELIKMKKETVCDNISMYAILSKNVDSLALCLGNENIVDSFMCTDVEGKYPIYCDMLRIHFDLALERKQLIDSAKVTLHTLFRNVIQNLGYENVPDVIIQYLLDMYNVRDLKKISLVLG